MVRQGVKPDFIPSNTADTTKKEKNKTFTQMGNTFTRAIPELNGVIIDVMNTKKAGHFDASKKLAAGYFAKEFRRGGNIGHTILHQQKFVLPIPRRPKKPSGTISKDQEDDYEFQQSGYNFKVKAYNTRDELLAENMHKTFSIFLGQCTPAILGRLELMSTWIMIRGSMDVLGFLELLKKITYSYKGSRNHCHVLIDVRENQVNMRQGDLTCENYIIQFWTLVEALKSYGGGHGT